MRFAERRVHSPTPVPHKELSQISKNVMPCGEKSGLARKFLRHFQSREQAAGIGPPRAGKLQRRSMIYGGSNNR